MARSNFLQSTNFFVFILFLLVSASLALPSEEVDALNDLLGSFGETAPEDWQEGSDPCSEWYGITCSSGDANVIEISLTSLYLEGTIPDSFGDFSKLQYLDFSENSLSGPIPDSMSNLKSLSQLYLEDNDLTGTIPSYFGNIPSLTIFRVGYNNFQSGEIPESYGNLVKLQRLALPETSRTGTIPQSLSSLVNLEILNLEGNELTSPLPTFLQRNPGYQVELTENNFCCPLPSWMDSSIATCSSHCPASISSSLLLPKFFFLLLAAFFFLFL